jgi:hypothetical protein
MVSAIVMRRPGQWNDAVDLSTPLLQSFRTALPGMHGKPANNTPLSIREG